MFLLLLDLVYLIFTTIFLYKLNIYSHTDVNHPIKYTQLNLFSGISCLSYFQTAGNIIAVGNNDNCVFAAAVMQASPLLMCFPEYVWFIYLLPSSISASFILTPFARTHTRKLTFLSFYCCVVVKPGNISFLKNPKPFFISLFSLFFGGVIVKPH